MFIRAWFLGFLVVFFPISLRAESISLAAKENLIHKVQISGYSPQFADDINQLKAKYDSDHSLSMKELIQLKDDISQLYVNRGYFNSGAYIPEQQIKNNQAKIVVLEGSVEEINVTGTKRLRENYVRRQLTDLPTPVNADDILDRLYALRKDPLIKGVSAELSSGFSPGGSILDVKVETTPGFALSSNYNNHRSPAIGTNAQNLELSHNNLLGFGDRLKGNYLNTSGSDSFNFGYSFPILRDSRLSFGYGFSNSEIIEEAFTPLDIETESDYFTLGFAQSLIRRSNRDLTIGLDFIRQNSQTSLLDSPFAISRGADEDGNTNISTLSFYQEYQAQGEANLLALRSRFNFGLDVFDATDNEDAPDSQYVSWVGEGQYVRALGDDFNLLFKSKLQLASDNLLPLEQLRLGGANTVRGFRRDILLADNGWFSSLELRYPLWRPTTKSVLQISPFLDFGTAWNNGEDFDLDVQTLASAGLGINIDTGFGLKASVDYGIPFLASELEEQAITFSLGYGR